MAEGQIWEWREQPRRARMAGDVEEMLVIIAGKVEI